MTRLRFGLNLSTKRTRKREFRDEMESVVRWAALAQVAEPGYRKAKTGRQPFYIEAMLHHDGLPDATAASVHVKRPVTSRCADLPSAAEAEAL